MMCLGLEPGAAGWKAQTNPLSYGGTPKANLNVLVLFSPIFPLKNTYTHFERGSITVQLIGLDSTKHVNLLLIQHSS